VSVPIAKTTDKVSAKEMLSDPHQIFTGLSIALRPSSAVKENAGHRFFGGLTGRLYDLSA
jgi:hypothetical protein